jgi:hypothetical protein
VEMLERDGKLFRCDPDRESVSVFVRKLRISDKRPRLSMPVEISPEFRLKIPHPRF